MKIVRRLQERGSDETGRTDWAHRRKGRPWRRIRRPASGPERHLARERIRNPAFDRARGQRVGRDRRYRSALKFSSQYTTAAINLTDLYRQLGRDTEGESALRAAIAASPRDAAPHHALGLVLTRLKRPDAALAELRRAAELEPGEAHYQYVLGVALHSGGQRAEAMALLKSTLQNHSANREILSALISFSRLSGDTTAALGYAEQLAAITPQDRGLAALIQELRRANTSPAH
jgi:Flp pilus assembly protein TadD